MAVNSITVLWLFRWPISTRTYSTNLYTQSPVRGSLSNRRGIHSSILAFLSFASFLCRSSNIYFSWVAACMSEVAIASLTFFHNLFRRNVSEKCIRIALLCEKYHHFNICLHKIQLRTKCYIWMIFCSIYNEAARGSYPSNTASPYLSDSMSSWWSTGTVNLLSLWAFTSAVGLQNKWDSCKQTEW